MIISGNVADNTVTFNGTINKSKWVTGSYKYLLTKPDKTVATYADLTINNKDTADAWDGTVDGEFTYDIVPTASGLYKVTHYVDTGITSSITGDTVLGEYYFNVVDPTTVVNFSI